MAVLAPATPSGKNNPRFEITKAVRMKTKRSLHFRTNGTRQSISFQSVHAEDVPPSTPGEGTYSNLIPW